MGKCKLCGSDTFENDDLCNACKTNHSSNSYTPPTKNLIGSILKGIGVAFIILGVVCGMLTSSSITSILKEANITDSVAPLTCGMMVLIGYCISGILLIGFSEIIMLLQAIKDKK